VKAEEEKNEQSRASHLCFPSPAVGPPDLPHPRTKKQSSHPMVHGYGWVQLSSLAGCGHGLIIRSGPWCDPMAQGTSSHYVRHRKSSSGRSPSAGSLRARKTATSSRVFSLSATSFPTGHRSAARGLRAGPRQQVLAPTGAAASAVPLVNVSTTSGRSPTAE
jgi:hypothetical protein